MPSKQSTVERAKELSHLIAILHKWGVHTLGDLAALEPDQLGARLGPLAVQLWEQANGRATRLLRLVRPAEVFAEQIEFEYRSRPRNRSSSSCTVFSSSSPCASTLFTSWRRKSPSG